MNKHLTGPISPEDIETLSVGDYIYYSGLLATGRDDVHNRVVNLGMDCPVDLNGLCLFHAGPIVSRTEDGRDLVAVGPTSSIRMEREEAAFIEKTGVRLIVGKGAMGRATVEACRKHKAIHCVFPGGCAVLAASCIERIEDLKWPELGMPEGMWVMQARELGPLVVTIDTKGNSLFEENELRVRRRRDVVLPAAQEKIRALMSE